LFTVNNILATTQLTFISARELKTATFGFSFSSFPPSLPPPTTATIRSPRKSPKKSPQKSPKKTSPQKTSPEKKASTALSSEQLAPVVDAYKPEPIRGSKTPKRKRPVTATATGEVTARSSKRRKIVEVPEHKADEAARDAGISANDLHEVSANLVDDKPKAAKRGRPAKAKKQVNKRQRITKNKIVDMKELAVEAVDIVVSPGDHAGVVQDDSGRDAEPSKKLTTTTQINLEHPITDKKVVAPASKRLARKKQAAQTEQVTTSPKDQQDNHGESVAIEERDRNIENDIVRGRKRGGPAPRYAESEGEEDSRPRKMAGIIKHAEVVPDISLQSRSNQEDEEAQVTQDKSKKSSSSNETAEASSEMPKRRGRPPKKAVVAKPHEDIKSTTESTAKESLTDEVQEYPHVPAKRTDSQPKRRGRPPKAKVPEATSTEDISAPVKELVMTKATPKLDVLSTKPRRGRPAKTAAKPPSAVMAVAVESTEDIMPTIQETSGASEISSETAQEVTAHKR